MSAPWWKTMLTPWKDPEAFEEMFLLDVLEAGINCDLMNLWEGNQEWVSKTIAPVRRLPSGNIACLFSGVTMKVYAPDHIVYLQKAA